MPATFDRPDLDLRVRKDLDVPTISGLHGTPHRLTRWRTRPTPLNQGRLGYSTGFGWAAMLENVDSERLPGSEGAAIQIAQGAHQDDQAHSRNRVVGASLLGGARYAMSQGWITGHVWTWSVDGVIDILCSYGPVLLGVPWFDSMYEPNEYGIVSANGTQVGRHAILATAYIPAHEALKLGYGPTNLVEFVPNLGMGYGVRGRAYLRLMDLAFMMKTEGEAVVPMNMQAREDLSARQEFMRRPLVRRLTSPFRRD